MPSTLRVPTTIRGRYGKLTLLPRRRKYEPYGHTEAGKPKTFFGHAHPGFPMVYYNPEKTHSAQLRTVIHESLHAWEPYWWRDYGGKDGPPEQMVRRLESCVWDLLSAYLDNAERE